MERDASQLLYDGPIPYNFEPVVIDHRERERPRVRNDGHRREIELWCQENEWRTGQSSWCLCGKCQFMPTAEESMCCREVDAYWTLVEKINPPQPNITCLTEHPGFEACCLNPYVLQIAYLNFRQEFGPLVATQHEQYRYTAYRQVVRWAYGILGRHIRKPIPSCIVSIIRNSFPEQGQYKGFQWANLPNYE
ncbi:unnamed protein product [Knipowitschia caucasica]